MPVAFSGVQKICQLIGDWDRELGQPTFTQTESRFGIAGTDLGSSFEHNGKLWFLFGDTWPARARVSGLAAVSRYAGHMELFYLTQSGVVDALPNIDDRWWDAFPM